MRIRAKLSLRIGQADTGKHLDNANIDLGFVAKAMGQWYLAQLCADTQVGIQRLHRILKYDPDSPCPQRIQDAVARPKNLLPVELNAATGDRLSR